MIILKKFNQWLKNLGQAWMEKDMDLIASICAKNVKYYETPFGKPLIGREAVKRQWEQDVPEKQKDICFDYEILTTDKNLGIAHWQAEFTTLPDGKRMGMDGIFQVSLNSEGKCTEFHQWWVVK